MSTLLEILKVCLISLSPLIANYILKKLNYKISNSLIKVSIFTLLLSILFQIYRTDRNYVEQSNWFYILTIFCYGASFVMLFVKSFNCLRISAYLFIVGFILYWIGIWNENPNNQMSISLMLFSSIGVFIPGTAIISYLSSFGAYSRKFKNEVNDVHRNILILILGAIMLAIFASNN